MLAMTQFRVGLHALWRGLIFFGRHRALWPWALMPWVLQVLCFVIASVVFTQFSEQIIAAVPLFIEPVAGPEGAVGFWAVLLNGLIGIVNYALKLAVFIFAFAATFFTGFVVALIFSGPFHDIISERTERIILGQSTGPASDYSAIASLGRIARCEIQKALLFLLIPLVAFTFNILPVVGGAIAIVLIGIYEMWATGFGFVDYVMGRQELSFRARLAFARKHRWSLLGFGTAFWIPGCLFFGTPFLAVAGTLLYHQLPTESHDLPTS